jgi:hypothetical protein
VPTSTPATPTDIDPKAVLNQLWSQTSFRCILEIKVPGGGEEYLPAIWVREPESYYLRMLDKKDKNIVVAHFITIGKREWMGTGTRPDAWYALDSLTDDKKEATKELMTGQRDIIRRVSAEEFPQGLAKAVGTSVKVDDVICNEYVCVTTEGQEAHFFISADSGLPVKVDLGVVTLSNIGHINDPANVIKSPISEFPKKLHIDDARMSLNGLSSFRWNHWIKIANGVYCEGTFSQLNQACHIAVYDNKGKEAGTPSFECLKIGQEQWVGKGEIWTPYKWTDDSYYAEPFYIWYMLGNFEKGNLMANREKTINGKSCNEYLFLWQGINDQGDAIKQELHLFASTDSGLPMYLEFLASGARASASLSWELSNIDDPSNIIEPPINVVEK